MHLGTVIGKFRLERRLGHGAMGDVYLGVHVELGSFVAIKILNAAACAEPNGVARFVTEAKAVAAIDHEQIARVIDQDQLPDGTPYIVMEFVEGVTLRELIDERGPLGLRLTVELMLDVLSALAVAHARGIVHRDLKPENLRVTKSGRAKILDFGIAKVLTQAPTALTQQGMLVGTPYYMSPEQIDGLAIDGRSDLYAIGVILFECVTGKRPFEGSTVVALLHRHLHEPPVSPSFIRPEVTPGLESVILRAMEKQPVLRFGSAEELTRALNELLPGLPPDGPVVRRERPAHEVATPSLPAPQGTTEDALGYTVRTPMTRRFRRPVVPLAVVVVLVLLGLGWFTRPDAPVPAVIPVQRRAATVKPVVAAVAPSPPPAPAPVPVAPPKKQLKAAQAPPAPEPSPAASGVTLIETSAERLTLPVDFDPRAFNPIQFLSRAQALARTEMPDAVLTNFNVSGLFAGDSVDLTPSREFGADYYFRSPSKSVADPRLRDEDQDIPCLQYVIVTAKKIEVYTAESFNGCREKPLPPIRCSLSQVLAKATQEGLKEPGKAMNISWLVDGWFLDFGGSNGSMSVSCP